MVEIHTDCLCINCKSEDTVLTIQHFPKRNILVGDILCLTCGGRKIIKQIDEIRLKRVPIS
jgi:hypothetical protein